LTRRSRYSPDVAATARAGLKKLRARFPGARQLVYDRRQSLPIGFAPSLMTQALRLAAADLRAGRGQVVLKSRITK
jgi:hypothetical protein